MGAKGVDRMWSEERKRDEDREKGKDRNKDESREKGEDRMKGEGGMKCEGRGGRFGGNRNLIVGTKYLLDIMFYAGIGVTASLPLSVKLIGEWFPWLVTHYEETVIIYFVLGVSAVVLVRELRRIFRTVLKEDCFVEENVESLRKMGNWSFFIALMAVVRSIVYMSIAMLVVILVFVIAGLFSKVLAYVFEEAVRYKQENDLTI